MIPLAKKAAVLRGALFGLALALPAFAPPPVAAAQIALPKKLPAKTIPDKPVLVASFGDWGVYQTQAAKGRVCYTLAQPKDRAPAELKRDAAYAFISSRPGEGVRNEISFIMGFDVASAAEIAKFKPPGKEAAANVGEQSFELLPKGANLWVKNAAKEGQLIEEMRKGAKLQVKAASKRGNATIDSYSLAGFGQALDRVQKDCPAK